jgi:hypothetical protein
MPVLLILPQNRNVKQSLGELNKKRGKGGVNNLMKKPAS